MSQNSTQITGIAFSELKAEKKQLVTEIKVKCCFIQISIGIDLSCRQISWLSRGRRSHSTRILPKSVIFGYRCLSVDCES